MRNSIQVTSDHNSMVLVDEKNGNQQLSISKRGILLSVLGTDIVATEVSEELEGFIKEKLERIKAFYEFEVADARGNQLCVTYNQRNNTVYIIGITDVDVSFQGPTLVPGDGMVAYGVRLKEKPSAGLSSSHVILARLETSLKIGSKKQICFYYLPVTAS